MSDRRTRRAARERDTGEVSPYLRQRLRTLDEALRDRERRRRRFGKPDGGTVSGSPRSDS